MFSIGTKACRCYLVQTINCMTILFLAQDFPVEEGAAAVSMRKEGEGVGPVMNVSGTDPNHWPPQEFGEKQL